VLTKDVQVALNENRCFAGTRTGGHGDMRTDLVSGSGLFWQEFAFAG
jgi:hypothetical protein